MAGRSGARLVVLLLLALVGRRASWRPVALISGASEGWYAGMVDYWGTFYRRTWPLHPLGSLFRAAPLSPEEQAEEKKMQEAYFTDDSLRGVLITVGASLPVTLLTLLIFEHFLRGEPGGLLQSLGLPRMLFSETSASRPAVVARRPSDGTELRAAMPDSLRRVIAPPPLSRWRQKPPQRSGHVSAARRKFTNKLRLRLAQLLRVLLTVNERTVLECAGMDALVMLRFCALCGRFCALSSLWCLLLVFCFTAGGYLRATEPYRGLGLCSISNVGPNSRLLWAVVPVSYLCTLTLCGLLWREYERFVQLRRIFFLCGGRLGERPMLSDPSPREPWPHGSATDEELNTDARFTRGLTPPTMARLRTAMPGVEGRRREATAAPEEDLLAQTRRTVLVERLPPELREPGALQAHFEEWLGAGTVHSVSPVPSDAKKLSQCWRSLRRGRQRQGSLRDEDLEELSELELHLRARREEFHLGWSTAASRMHIIERDVRRLAAERGWLWLQLGAAFRAGRLHGPGPERSRFRFRLPLRAVFRAGRLHGPGHVRRRAPAAEGRHLQRRPPCRRRQLEVQRWRVLRHESGGLQQWHVPGQCR
ncbi:unnamed protein product [Prorocentrum cordatum]|uniref:CSC1/OSCA1-like N-terminal transmembrane domain-containing protein n=1 Tax=Prorocentrum cordatum TaxID=2364126 RepID=A0ABN9TPL4_9DINO|nr:unnamed protein product [Polarella glacialis]